MSTSSSMEDQSSSPSSSPGPSTPTSSHAILASPSRKARSLEEDQNTVVKPWWKENPQSFHTLHMQDRFEEPSSSRFEHQDLQSLVAPHIESFNALWSANPSVEPSGSSRTTFGEGVGLLEKSIRNIPPRVIFDAAESERQQGRLGNRMELRVEGVNLARPTSTEKGRTALHSRVYPAECRERLMTYRARMTAKISWRVNGQPKQMEERDMGLVPIMIKSNRCHLRGKVGEPWV